MTIVCIRKCHTVSSGATSGVCFNAGNKTRVRVYLIDFLAVISLLTRRFVLLRTITYAVVLVSLVQTRNVTLKQVKTTS
jgi:hypothetical protein